jgi:hypothetical protein
MNINNSNMYKKKLPNQSAKGTIINQYFITGSHNVINPEKPKPKINWGQIVFWIIKIGGGIVTLSAIML